jgi:hypothetical protein
MENPKRIKEETLLNKLNYYKTGIIWFKTYKYVGQHEFVGFFVSMYSSRMINGGTEFIGAESILIIFIVYMFNQAFKKNVYCIPEQHACNCTVIY